MKQSASSEGTTIDLYSYMLEQEDALYNVMYSSIPEGAAGDPAAMLKVQLLIFHIPLRQQGYYPWRIPG